MGLVIIFLEALHGSKLFVTYVSKTMICETQVIKHFCLLLIRRWGADNIPRKTDKRD
jgi:hypothetical protein